MGSSGASRGPRGSHTHTDKHAGSPRGRTHRLIMCAIAYAKHKCPLAKGSLADSLTHSLSLSVSAADSDIWLHSEGRVSAYKNALGSWETVDSVCCRRSQRGPCGAHAANKIMRNPQNMFDRVQQIVFAASVPAPSCSCNCCNSRWSCSSCSYGNARCEMEACECGSCTASSCKLLVAQPAGQLLT